VSKAFTEWYDVIVHEVSERERLGDLFTFHSQMSESQAQANSRIVASTVQKIRMRDVAKAMKSWQELANKKTHIRNIAKKVIKRADDIAVSMCLWSWIAMVDDIKHMRSTIEMVVKRLGNTTVASVFGRWLSMIETRHAMQVTAKRVVARMLQASRATAVNPWKD
jgi:hypothetical protein